MRIIKSNGSFATFDPNKIRTWIKWALSALSLQERLDMEHYVLTQTLARLPQTEVKTSEIHQTVIGVCLDKEDIDYSRLAAILEVATIHKNQEKLLNMYKPESATYTYLVDSITLAGLYQGSWLNEINEETEKQVNEWFVELEAAPLEYWVVKQFADKYSMKVNKEAVETPACAALSIAIAYHGVTDLAFNVAKDIIFGKANYPTPALNGVRNGSFDSISCCVIEAGDTVDSIDVADHIASKMTSKKAGIGITVDSRSKGDPVKNGAVEHLGKSPLYRSIEAAVKKYTQVSRGGSATMTVKCIDPDIESMLLWKTQRIDLSQRIDKIDYSFAYNEAFLKAVIYNENWYLFSKYWAPDVHESLHLEWEDYEEVVKEAIQRGVPYKKVKAIDVLTSYLEGRWETGRFYCINLTEANRHTPFKDTIKQSNLCMEIFLPTKPYINMFDLYAPSEVRKYMLDSGYTQYNIQEEQGGETAFCSLAALNWANIKLEEFFEVAERTLRTVNQMIERAGMMTPTMRKQLLDRRSVGIGVVGAASLLYKNGLDYDGSEESLDMIAEYSELHYFSLLKASQKMAKETGIVCKGIDLDWLPIDTKRSDRVPLLDWESVRGIPRMHSVLVAMMPTESSSAFSNATNGKYPSRQRVTYKSARQGFVQFISEHFIDKMSAYDVDMIPYYKEFQSYADQGLSADHYTNFTKLPNRKIKMETCIEWFIDQGMAGIKSAYYQNFLDTDGELEMEETCDEGGCKL